jgi:lipoprotein-releasing system permease protein
VEAVVPFIEGVFGFKFFAKDVYLISEVPSEVQRPDILLTAMFSFVVCVLATLYPSWRASRISPAEALRYE